MEMSKTKKLIPLPVVVSGHKVVFLSDAAAIIAALVSARDALVNCEGAFDECKDYPITHDEVITALEQINAVLSGHTPLQPAGEEDKAIYAKMAANYQGQPVEDPRDAKIASLQAKIDALMLEYCPEEMTPEQMEGWGKHQVVYEDPRDKSDCHGPDWTERDMEYLK